MKNGRVPRVTLAYAVSHAIDLIGDLKARGQDLKRLEAVYAELLDARDALGLTDAEMFELGMIDQVA